MTKQITVLGAGSWGSAVANVFAENGQPVILWTRDQTQADEITNQHTNETYLPDAKLNAQLTATSDMGQAVANAEIIIFAVPTKAIREVAKQLNQLTLLPTGMIGHVTKGIETDTYKRVTEIIGEELTSKDPADYFFIAGPSHAESVIKHDLTMVTVASNNDAVAQTVQEAMGNHDYFRVYRNNDLLGSEYAAALKNVLAIGGGALAGMGYSDNATAAYIVLGLKEMTQLVVALGGKEATLNGLSGLGDLIVTAGSANSRNYRAGYQLAQGKDLATVEQEMGMVIEGVRTARAVHDLAEKYQVEMPISQAVYDVLYNDQDFKAALKHLMERPLTTEDNS